MTFLRSIIVLFALLSQVVPAQAMLQVSKVETCQMSCCASLVLTEMSVCGCSHAPVPAEPTQAPQGNGRELVQQVVWSVAYEAGFQPRISPADDVGFRPLLQGEHPLQPQVRLSVLFCSFLN